MGRAELKINLDEQAGNTVKAQPPPTLLEGYATPETLSHWEGAVG